MEDAAILELLRRGEIGGVEALQERYGGLMRYIAGNILPDHRDAEECVSDVCLALWRGAGRFDPTRGSLSAWISAITRNAAVSRLRAARRQAGRETGLPEDTPGGENPEEAVLRRERAEGLRAALRTLSSLEQTLFYRRYYYLQSAERMAADLGLSARAVEGRLYRLRRKLQKRLGGDWDG